MAVKVPPNAVDDPVVEAAPKETDRVVGRGSPPQFSPGSGAGPRRRWGRWLVLGGAAAATLGLTAGLLIWAPWVDGPATPTAVRAGSPTATSLSVSWSPASGGPKIDHYLILREGVEVGSVPGAQDSYLDRDLAPGTIYRYAVVAVSGSRRSAPSEVAIARSLAPSPVGLKADSATTDSVAFHWSRPPNSPVPDKYVITRDGKTLGSVPGTVRSYKNAGLTPVSVYRYQVTAVWGQQRSAPSAALKIRTLTPLLSAARLSGSFEVQFVLTAESGFTEREIGDRFTETWYFDPRCGSGACATRLTNYDASGLTVPDPWASWKMQLTRDGARYSGTTKASLSNCWGIQVSDTIVVALQVTRARMLNGQWTAVAWSGTYKDTAPYTKIGLQYCPSASFTALVRGS